VSKVVCDITISADGYSAGLNQIEAVLGDRYVRARTLSPFDILYERADLAEPDASF